MPTPHDLMEALKLLIGRRADLAGSLLRVEGAGLRIRQTPIERDPRCPVCSR